MISFDDGYDWGDYIASENMTFEIMKGYSVWLTAAKTIEIEGDFNTGEIEYPAINIGNNFNLVGNPYPSAIDWEANSGWTRNRISTNIWMWNQDAGNYGIYLSGAGGGLSTNNAIQYIPACQGFFIQTTGSNPILKINNEARIHDDQAFFKTTPENNNLIRLTVTGTNGKDEILIRFINGATNDFDENLDIEKLEGSVESPQLYSIYSDKNYSITSFPELIDNKMIPVYFEPRLNGDFNIDIIGISGFDEEIKIIFEDNLNRSFTELNSDYSYSFKADTFNQFHRFNLHFINNILSETNSNEPDIFSSDEFIYIRAYETLSGQIEIYNLIGQSILNVDIKSSINKINMQGKKGVFIIHLTTEDLKFSKRLFLE